MILYFSGTGNSRYVAKRIAKAAGDGLVDLNDKIRRRDNGPINGETKLVFVFPTYAWRIPRIVEQWIRNTEFIGAKNIWFVMTCGDEVGNAGKYNLRLCAEKGWNYKGTAQIVMPENYIAMFAVPKPATAQKIIQKAEPVIDDTAKMIADGQMLPEQRLTATDRLKSGIVNAGFYLMAVKTKAFRTTDACISCGQCTELCPLNNIRLAAGKPVWGPNCTHCMACICFCPKEAIEYGKKSIGKPRYHCDL